MRRGRDIRWGAKARRIAEGDTVQSSTPDARTDSPSAASPFPKSGLRFAVGLGLTNACNLSCAHCYRDVGPARYLTLADVQRVCESLPVRAANLGTGENGLHPDFLAIVDYLTARDIAVSVTSNGFTLAALTDEQLRRFHDVEVSIDFPTESEQDLFRGAGNWRLVNEQLARCQRLGVTATVIAVMMRTNFRRLA